MIRNAFIIVPMLFVLALPAAATDTAAALPQFLIMTEHWVPYQFEENGSIQGISVDLLVDLLRLDTHVNHSNNSALKYITPYIR